MIFFFFLLKVDLWSSWNLTATFPVLSNLHRLIPQSAVFFVVEAPLRLLPTWVPIKISPVFPLKSAVEEKEPVCDPSAAPTGSTDGKHGGRWECHCLQSIRKAGIGDIWEQKPWEHLFVTVPLMPPYQQQKRASSGHPPKTSWLLILAPSMMPDPTRKCLPPRAPLHLLGPS